MSISTVIVNRANYLAGITVGLVAGALQGFLVEYETVLTPSNLLPDSRYHPFFSRQAPSSLLTDPMFPRYSTSRQFTDVIKPGDPLDFDMACDYIMDEIGSEIDLRNERGETALIVIATHYWGAAQTTLIELLLAAGADIDASSTIGLTPLMAHIKHGFRAEYASLSAHDRITSRIGGGDVMCSNEVVRMLINGGCDINLEVEGRTALYTAIVAGNTAVVRILLEAGAKIGIYSHKMSWVLPTYASAITVAVCGKNRYEMVKLLLDAGADVNYRSFYTVCDHQFEITAFLLALQYYRGDEDDVLIELLLKARAEITMIDGACVLSKISQDAVRSAAAYELFKKYYPLLEIDYSRVPEVIINEVRKMDGEYEYWSRFKVCTVLPSIRALNRDHD